MAKMKDKAEIPEDVIERLLASVDDPRELLEPDGLLKQLMGRLVERSLKAELTEHLGYEEG